MDKIVRFIDCAVPVLTCNLRCKYCYITQQRKFLNALPVFSHDAKYLRKALSKERLGGIAHLNMCGGGETLMPPEMIDILRELLEEGHYIAVVTNGTMSNRFDEIIKFPKELLERLMFKFSFHYLEFKRLGWFDKFFENIEKVKNAGCSFSVEITPSDELIPEIPDLKKMCMERLGALCHVTVARDETDPKLPILTELSKEDYLKTWGQFDSDLFAFKMKTFYVKRKEFCYGGLWTAYLNLGTGLMRQCYCGKTITNIFKNIDKPIKFTPIGKHCMEPHCHNSHVWLTLGAIPSLETPTYAMMRNRVTIDGSEWLNPKMKAFLSQKLKDNNDELDLKQQKKINRKSGIYTKFSGVYLKTGRFVKKLIPSKIKIKHAKKMHDKTKKYEDEN